jgi:hypothetical protein
VRGYSMASLDLIREMRMAISMGSSHMVVIQSEAILVGCHTLLRLWTYILKAWRYRRSLAMAQKLQILSRCQDSASRDTG